MLYYEKFVSFIENNFPLSRQDASDAYKSLSKTVVDDMHLAKKRRFCRKKVWLRLILLDHPWRTNLSEQNILFFVDYSLRRTPEPDLSLFESYSGGCEGLLQFHFHGRNVQYLQNRCKYSLSFTKSACSPSSQEKAGDIETLVAWSVFFFASYACVSLCRTLLSFCDSSNMSKATTPPPALLLLLSRLCRDFEQSTVAYILTLTDEQFMISNKQKNTQVRHCFNAMVPVQWIKRRLFAQKFACPWNWACYEDMWNANIFNTVVICFATSSDLIFTWVRYQYIKAFEISDWYTVNRWSLTFDSYLLYLSFGVTVQYAFDWWSLPCEINSSLLVDCV